MLTYNLFKHKDEADLYCAVPEDRPVPTFLTADKWEYASSLDIKALSNFDPTASRSARDSDFFLFQLRTEAAA
ncbi:hypothetical protein DC522_21180 [Microvirga sp. KLBC 81]|uniref:hypothetical protein n=1 Tax=Microvirga sp. KLBC 81 TaxID=1862707 RepID=UPI000D51761A|nr:hypothetical protein [Microvirga sp. KLBC 81]PVE22400.1 hypothetical protein DC522_21180 [Microvirga sp. KLBC 81]